MPDHKLISADSHINESEAIWKRVQKKHGDRAPKIVQCEEGSYFVVEGWTNGGSYNGAYNPTGKGFSEDCSHEYVALAIDRQGGDPATQRERWRAPSGAVSGLGISSAAQDFRKNFRFEDFAGACYDPAARLKDQDRDGVEAEVLYPSMLAHIYEMSAEDEPFFHDIVDSYNEWVMDFASYNPKRLIAQPMLSVLNPEGAAADIRKYAKRGAKGFTIASSVPLGMSYGDKTFDPIWAAAEECDVPLGGHVGAGRFKQFPFYSKVTGAQDGLQYARGFVGLQGEMQVSLSELIYGGVFDRFPKLKIISAEFHIGWVAYTAQRFKAPLTGLGLKLSPAEYMARNIWFTFQDDRAGCLTTPAFGSNNFLWASDYPHPASTWPNSQAKVDAQFEGISEEVKRKITRQNIIDLYKLDL